MKCIAKGMDMLKKFFENIFAALNHAGPEIFGNAYLPVTIYKVIKNRAVKPVLFVLLLFLLIFAFAGVIVLITGQIKF